MLVKIEGSILHFIFRSKNIMVQSFAELSYYYEGKRYFDGYNMDVETMKNYFQSKDTFNKCEKELKAQLLKHEGVRYVIAYIQNDSETRDHELRHARYYLDSEYKSKVLKVWSQLDEKTKENVKQKLRCLGYREDKWVDEAQAYEMI